VQSVPIGRRSIPCESRLTSIFVSLESKFQISVNPAPSTVCKQALVREMPLRSILPLESGQALIAWIQALDAAPRLWKRELLLPDPSAPDIDFIPYAAVALYRFYATYVIAVYFVKGAIYDHKDCVPLVFRLVGLHRAAGYILGVDPTEAAPRIAIRNDTRPIDQPYVCIAVQSTLQAKFWNNPTGWRDVVAFLKDAGNRVVCIDQKASHGQGWSGPISRPGWKT
jgi:hypothetical protein